MTAKTIVDLGRCNWSRCGRQRLPPSGYCAQHTRQTTLVSAEENLQGALNRLAVTACAWHLERTDETTDAMADAIEVYKAAKDNYERACKALPEDPDVI